MTPIRRIDIRTKPLLRQHSLALAFFIILFVVFYSPAIFSSHALAPGDGFLYYLPHYELPFSLWNPDLMTGFPEMADPQLMKWYVPYLLFSWVPGSWNAFVITAYVLASWFTYLFVWSLGDDVLAAIISGLIYGLSGFMVAHLGHTTIIHAAAWTPALLLAIERLACSFRVRWVLFGGFAFSQCILAGHPQIALYGLTLAAAYVVFRARKADRSPLVFCFGCGLMIVLASMLSACQTLATATLASITPRAALSFEQFSQYSMSPYNLALLFFPCLFGGAGAALFQGVGYFGSWNLTEVACYVGFAALVLACMAVFSFWRDVRVIFWVVAAVPALLGAMGPATPLGHLIYVLPGFGNFRAPARFVGIFCFCAAVLAGYGIIAVRKQPRNRRHLLVVVTAVIALFVGATLPSFFAAQIRAAAAGIGFPKLPVSISENPWLQIPLISGVVSACLICLYWWRPRNRIIQALLIFGIVAELGTFGWFAEWRYASPLAQALRPSPSVEAAARVLRREGGRWLAVNGSTTPTANAPPDRSALWGLPSVGKYGPLMPNRFADLLETSTNGQLLGKWWNDSDRSLDIVGARLLGIDDLARSSITNFKGFSIPQDEINLIVGNGCGAEAAHQSIVIPQHSGVSSVAVVSMLGCSVGIEQGSPVVAMHLSDQDGTSRTITLRAGIDTAEWAASCADVAPIIRHRPAEVVSRFPVLRGGGTCQGQRYGSVTRLLDGTLDVRSIDFEWLPKNQGVIRITGLAFGEERGRATSLTQTDTQLANASRWKLVSRTRDSSIFENMRALPRCWLVPQTETLPPPDIERSIKTSRLPDGRAYNPKSIALVEAPLAFHAAPDPDGRAWVVSDKKSNLDIETTSHQPAFLVIGDFYYPGWKVLVNGRPSTIFQTNYIQRGVLLPAGHNHVRFEFFPTTFYAGLTLSGAGILASALAAGLSHKRGIL